MTDFFQNKKPDLTRLKRYGFCNQGGVWRYHVRIMEGQFELLVTIVPDGAVKIELTECELGEPYTLHLVEEAGGEFVGKIRAAYEHALEAIAEACFDSAIFKEPLTAKLLAHAREKYGDEPEYLWEKFPDDAILRRKDSAKWYAGIFTAKRASIGLEGDGKIEILDVRADPAELPLLLDGVRVLPGWHMNKKHWVTLPLDGTVPLEEIIEYLEESWHLAK